MEKSSELNNSQEKFSSVETEVNSIVPDTNVEVFENQDYRSVAPGDLKLSELDNAKLDKVGVEFKTAILESLVNTNTYPKMTIEDLERDFNLVIDGLQTRYNDASLKEISALGSQKLKELVVEIFPPVPQTERTIMLSEGAVQEFKTAINELKSNLSKHISSQKKEMLSKASLIGKLRGLLGSEPQDETIDGLQADLNYLSGIEDMGALNEAMLKQPLFYIDVRGGKAGKGTLSTALQFGTSNLNYLSGYIQELNATPLSSVLPDKIVSAIEMVAGGYGVEPFSEDKSMQQMKSGTAFAARTGNIANYLQQNYYKSIKIKN